MTLTPGQRPVVGCILAAAVGLVFAFAGLTKLLVWVWVPMNGAFLSGPDAFSLMITQHRVLPAEYAPAIAWTVIVGELALASLLLFGPIRRWAGLSALVLLCVFSAYMWRAHAVEGQVACGCFGGVTTESLWITLARNTVLSGAAWMAWVLLARPPLPNR